MRRPAALAICGVLFIGLLPRSLAGQVAQEVQRQVYVTVTDGKGVAIPGLTSLDFQVREGGQDRLVTQVEPATARMRMAILVEESLTPTGGVRQGLAQFIQRMQPHAEMSLVVMGLRNFKVVDYTTDIGALFSAINAFSLYRHQQQLNNVSEGIFEAARTIETERHERPVMVVVAQEMMQQSSEAPHRVLDQIRKSGAQVEVVTVESGQANVPVGSLSDMSGRAQILGDGSRQSGGRRIEVTALTAVPRALQQVADGLLGQYRLTYSVPAGAKPSDRLSVDLRRRDATLRAPTRIAALGAATR